MKAAYSTEELNCQVIILNKSKNNAFSNNRKQNALRVLHEQIQYIVCNRMLLKNVDPSEYELFFYNFPTMNVLIVEHFGTVNVCKVERSQHLNYWETISVMFLTKISFYP